MLDYRYYRFLLHPETGLWRMARDWSDIHWTTTQSLRRGITSNESRERKTLFGKNAIEIQAKSIFALLIEEVRFLVLHKVALTVEQCLHPFYVFQVASIILWTLDDYQLYAATIFIISVISIITTLVETRSVSVAWHIAHNLPPCRTLNA